MIRSRPAAQVANRPSAPSAGQKLPAPAPNHALDLSTLTPAHVLQLQRLVGNQGVIKLLQREPAPTRLIQRVFDNKATFLGKTDTTDRDFIAIGDLLDQYNTFLGLGVKTEDDYKNGFTVLRQIDRAIHDWFDAVSRNYRDFASAPHTAEMETLRLQAETEHADLIDQTKTMDLLPFDTTGMNFLEVVRLFRLWKSIKNATGKVQIVGNPAEKKRYLAMVAKLLDTPTGRRMMGYLNAGNPADLMTNVYLGEKKSDLPPTLQGTTSAGDSTISQAQPLKSGSEQTLGQGEDLTGAENPHDFVTYTQLSDIREAVLQGKKGFIYNGKKYLFDKAKGVGSLVTAKSGVSRNENALHNQILTPGFITLGHELGHSVHMRGGAASLNQTEMLPLDTSGRSMENLKDVWQNTEELFTISNFENALRAETGLSQRASHIPYTAGKKIRRYYTIRDPFVAQYLNRDIFFVKLPEIDRFQKDLKSAKGTIDQDTVFNKIQGDWVTLQHNVGDTQLRTWKRTELQTHYGIARTRFKKLWLPGKTLKNEYQAIKHEMQTNLATYTGIGNPHVFDNFLTRIDDLRDKSH